MQRGKALEKSTERLRGTTEHKNHFHLTIWKPVENYEGVGGGGNGIKCMLHIPYNFCWKHFYLR